jgi:hypothetical protein
LRHRPWHGKLIGSEALREVRTCMYLLAMEFITDDDGEDGDVAEMVISRS